MSQTITAKIDVMKIEKARLFAGKNGAKYLDLVLIPSTNDKYGNDFLIVQGVSKEERQSGVKGAILGNGKFIGGGRREASQPQRARDDDGMPPF